MIPELIKGVGGIRNEYGQLHVKKEDGKFFWAIEDYNGFEWEEIPKKLYDALIDFEDGGK